MWRHSSVRLRWRIREWNRGLKERALQPKTRGRWEIKPPRVHSNWHSSLFRGLLFFNLPWAFCWQVPRHYFKCNFSIAIIFFNCFNLLHAHTFPWEREPERNALTENSISGSSTTSSLPLMKERIGGSKSETSGIFSASTSTAIRFWGRSLTRRLSVGRKYVRLRISLSTASTKLRWASTASTPKASLDRRQGEAARFQFGSPACFASSRT